MKIEEKILQLEKDYIFLFKEKSTKQEFIQYNKDFIFENGIHKLSQNKYDELIKCITVLEISHIKDTKFTYYLYDLKDRLTEIFIDTLFSHEKKSTKKQKIFYNFIDK